MNVYIIRIINMIDGLYKCAILSNLVFIVKRLRLASGRKSIRHILNLLIS